MDFKILFAALVVTLHQVQCQECRVVLNCNDEDEISNSDRNLNIGNIGRRGGKGDRGIPGKAGPSGLHGLPGEKGNQGVHGLLGIKGTAGIQGIPGEKGNQGVQGPPGIDGAAGLQGLPGEKGNQGVHGPPGIDGAAGIQGPPGERGSQGVHGPPGINGAIGIQGLPGEKGNQGVKGESGSTDGITTFQQEIRNLMTDFNHSLSLLESQLKTANGKINDIWLPESCAQSDENGSQLLRFGERAYCHRHWRVIQRRFNGQVIFYNKNWNEYKNGFGNMSTEFWIGLDKIHHLTRNGGCRLRVELGAFDGSEAYAEYRVFSIGSESDLFRLHISGYSGTAGDSIMQSESEDNNNMAFSTIDRDNDRRSDLNCAAVNGGGIGAWWHNQCGYAFLNGRWRKNLDTVTSFTWYHWKNAWITLKSSMMMIRCD